MEFRFDIGHYFKHKIVQVKNNLVPSDFNGDRRIMLDTTSKFSEIINDMGEASARAQGLSRPVTTAQKLRNSDHIVYLMYEKGGKNGLVTGLLKIGKKLLYVFDSEGETHTVDAPCVLDFYVHESRQRFGLGKEMYTHMLVSEGYKANQMAIDRPSEKLLAFLRKHYSLEHQIPQMNNFVIYDGFFEMNQDGNNNNISALNGPNLHITDSPNMLLFGPQFKTTPVSNRTNTINSSHKNQPITPTIEHLQGSPIGRYAANRPLGSMAQIIHNSPTVAAVSRETDSRFLSGPSGYHSKYDRNRQYFPNQPSDRVEAAGRYQPSVYTDVVEDDMLEDDMQSTIAPSSMDGGVPIMKYSQQPPTIEKIEEAEEGQEEEEENVFRRDGGEERTDAVDGENHLAVEEEPIKVLQSPNQSFHYSKQHTGLKNLSFNVGAAVMPSSKMEFDQENRESFGVVKITRPVRKEPEFMPRPDGHTIIGRKKSLRLDIPLPNRLTSNYSNNNLTDQGFLDLKFYHNKLW